MTERDTKLTNPKDVISVRKLPLALVPQTAIALESLAFYEGASKYGAHNWRAAGVRGSVYIAALLRHVFKYWNGEDVDPETLIPHLANARACLGILIDAKYANKLMDDRPPANPGMVAMMADAEPILEHLQKLFKEFNPKHWTIDDDIETE